LPIPDPVSLSREVNPESINEPERRTQKSPHLAAHTHQRPVTAYQANPATGSSLRAAPECVWRARAFTKTALAEIAETDPEHVEDVVLVVDELVTNAILHAKDVRNVFIELRIADLWTIVIVDDRDPAVHESHAEDADDDLPVSGRGLLIVKSLAARFRWNHRLISKTANAAILRTDVKLSSEDEAVLDVAMAP
jgi:anti-sigma regulatory factor (Ser/Thr protein kinase)